MKNRGMKKIIKMGMYASANLFSLQFWKGGNIDGRFLGPNEKQWDMYFSNSK